MGDSVEYSTLKGDELRELCRKRDLPVSGTNPELIDRLRDYDASHPTDDAGSEDLLAESDAPAVVEPDSPAVVDLTTEQAAPAIDDAVAAGTPADDGDEPPTPDDTAQDDGGSETDKAVANPDNPRRGLVADNTFEATFAIQGAELGTGLHEEFRMRAYRAALDAGHTPKGGLASAYRDSFRDVNGERHAVYHVLVRR